MKSVARTLPDAPRSSRLPNHPELRCTPLTDDLADLLVARTLDPRDGRLRQMTRDLSRFSDRQRLARWHRGGRSVLCLQDTGGSLLGVVWVVERPMPPRDDYFDPALIEERGPGLTWAIRLYGQARGQGLAKAFSEHSLRELLRNRPGTPSLWYETRADNRVTRSLGKRLGFFEASGEEGGTVVGVRLCD